MKKKTVALLLALVLVFGVAAGGTLAWLTDKTDAVTNTFVAAELGTVTISESNANHEYMVVPGGTINKDPKLSFTRESTDKSVAAYVFVKITAANWVYDSNAKAYTLKQGDQVAMSWTLADGWIAVDGTSGVFYKEVAAGDNLTDIQIIKNNAITVNGDNVTKENIVAISGNATLTFQGFAIQKDNVGTAADAWAKINPTTNP